MKFILAISLCSFVNNTCLPPVEVIKPYNSWKECSIAAYEISKAMIIAQQDPYVNNNKLATKFTCSEAGVI
jgi:hypothetical protein